MEISRMGWKTYWALDSIWVYGGREWSAMGGLLQPFGKTIKTLKMTNVLEEFYNTDLNV